MSFRRVPLEVIQCRHCEKSIQTSEKHLCDALLCQDCFDVRENNRKGYPKVMHEKAEHNLLGDKYGENRGNKVVVCAACGQTYEVYKRLRDKFSKSCLEDSIKSNSLMYSDGPLDGWTNDILCKTCFDGVQLGCEDEILQLQVLETERLQKNAMRKAEEETVRRRIETKNILAERGLGKFVFILLLIFAIPIILSMCSGMGAGSKDSADVYYRK